MILTLSSCPQNISKSRQELSTQAIIQGCDHGLQGGLKLRNGHEDEVQPVLQDGPVGSGRYAIG